MNGAVAETLMERVLLLRNTLQARCTQDHLAMGDYEALRKELLEHPLTKPHMPAFVRQCRSTEEFWQFIKPQTSQYAERRAFLRDAFAPALDALEFSLATPADDCTLAILRRIDGTTVQDAWHKALERRTTDPEGALTIARTLIESVCKHILDEAGESYEEGFDLPKLYKLTAKRMNLTPAQHSEDVLKQILGGCASVIDGLGALRNRLSDAHGRGKKGVKPLPIHAELSVNLAGAMATFLLQTWEMRKSSGMAS